MKKALIRIAGVLLVLIVLLTAYGVAVEPRFILDERRYARSVPGLPEEWEGAEVAVFADLQIGMWWDNVGMARHIVERAIDEEPDVVLLGGDFVYSTSPGVAEQVDTVVELLRPLTDAGLPTFAVLGNHDHHTGADDELTTALEGIGIPVLANDSVVLPPPQGSEENTDPLHLVGLAATRPGLTDVPAALEDVPQEEPRLVLMHNPTAFPELPAHSAPLSVAGHTHCGQIALPGTPQWSYIGLTEEEKVVADGWAPADYGAEGNSLFVTCGVGFSILPVRINAAPQLVTFELTAEG